MQIIPSILPKTHSALVEKLGQLSGVGYTGFVQIDVCDGVFVSTVTEVFPMPEHNFDIEFDLMIHHPEEFLEMYLVENPKRIVIHIESVGDWELLRNKLANFPGEIGLSLSNETSVSDLESHIGIANFIQCMGIATIGLQGQPFDDRVLDKIDYLRQNHPNLPVSVDGAVSISTITRLSEHGVTRAAIGSAVFTGNIAKNLAELSQV